MKKQKNGSELITLSTDEDLYLEHEFSPNRKNNYLPNRFVFANAPFNRVEQRLWEFFINQINHQEFKSSHGVVVKIPISVIKNYVPESRQVMAVTKSMSQKVITLFDTSKSELEFKHIPIFTLIDYNSNKSGVLMFRSNPQLSPYLADLGTKYAKYHFDSVQRLKSTYATLMYKLLSLHIGQNRYTFVYSLVELKKLLQVDAEKYQNLRNFKINILDISQRECANAVVPITFTYENEGTKQRDVTHIRFTIITAIQSSKQEKQEFLEAVSINPRLVYSKAEEIMVQKYNFREIHKNAILTNENYLSIFVTLHIEFENGLHPKVKNKTAYILTCIGLVKKNIKKTL